MRQLVKVTSVGLCVLLNAACHAGVAPTVRQDHSVPAAVAADGGKAEAAGVQLRIQALPRTPPVLGVEVEARGDALDAWSSWRVGSLGPLADLTARDGSGDLVVKQEQLDDQLVVTFDRPVVEPLSLRYSLAGPAYFDERLHLTSENFVMTLAAVLLPRAEQKRQFRIEVQVDAAAGQSVATTLGGGAVHSLQAQPKQLQEVAVMAGPGMQAAHFDAREGRDDVYALGGPSFDVRWAAAELALSRSRIDEGFGGDAPAEFPWLIFARDPRQYVPPVVVQASGHGARLVVTRSEPWTARALLPAGQVIVRRWLGGVLRFGADDAWLTLGFTRFIALREQYAAGVLNAEDVLHELNAFESALTLNGSDKNLLGDMARGALYALRCDGLLRAQSTVRSLGDLFTPLIERAEVSHAEVPVAELEQRLAAALGDAEVAVFRQMRAGTVAPLPHGVPGRCFTEAKVTYQRFALGFDPPDPELDGPQPVRGLVAGGPAAKAGLRDGDLVHELRYVPGDPSVDAVLDIVREGVHKALRYKPSDQSKAGRGWTRNAAVRDEDCWLVEASDN